MTTGADPKAVYPGLKEMRNDYMHFGEEDKFDRSGFDQLFTSAAVEIVTNFNNNLYMHSFDHPQKTIDLCMPREKKRLRRGEQQAEKIHSPPRQGHLHGQGERLYLLLT